MTSIALIGILSGMVIGVLATLMRRHATFIILMPMFLAPAAYLVVWRESLIGHCVFAHHFHSDSCAPMRALLYQSLEHTADAIIVAIAHVIVGFTTVTVLSVVRTMIVNVDLRSPAEKEAVRLEYERRMEAQAEVKKRMEEDMDAMTKALLRARDLRESVRAAARSKASTNPPVETTAPEANG